MGKKALIKELEAALSQTLSDLAIDRQRHAMVVDAMTAGMKRLTEERDEAEKNVAELLRNNETADSVIRDLHKELEVLDGVASMFERDLATLQAQHSAVSDALDLEREHSAKTIGALRDDLADMRERLDAALTEAARMRKEWTGDVTAAREIVERKTAEIVELRRDVAAAQRERDAALGNWQNTESLLQERERELDALQEQHTEMSDELDELRAHSTKTIGDLRYQLQSSQAPVICSRCGRDILAKDDAAPAEPVVTLDAIFEMEEGEKLIDDDGVSIERTSCGYEIIGGARHGKSDFPGGAFSIYHTIKKGAAA